jgi:hypothetical protein
MITHRLIKIKIKIINFLKTLFLEILYILDKHLVLII